MSFEGLFEVWLCDPLGQRLLFLDGFSSLNIVKVTNSVGAFTIDMAVNIDKSLLWEDRMIEIDYTPPGGTQYVEAVGFIRHLHFYDDENGHEQVKITCYGQNYILTSRIIAYAAGTAQASKTDYADDMLKAIIHENLGSSASGARNLTSLGLGVAGDLADAPSITKSFAWKELLPVLQEIAAASAENGTRLYFELVPVLTNAAGIGYDFRTYTNQPGINRGSDSGNELYFGKDWGNLDKPELDFDWEDEVTYVYAGGQGNDSVRLIEQVYDAERVGASVWNRREAFAAAGNESTSAGVQAKGYSALNEGKPRVSFSGELKDTESAVYGKDWGLGYVVIAEYQGFSFDVLVNAVIINLNEVGKVSIVGQFEVLNQYQ